MKITLEASVLADAVAWAARTIPQRPTAPVLGGILLHADADTLTLSAFDYDTSARATVAADVAEPGTVLLPGRVLAQIAASLPGKPVELTLSGSEATIRCGSSEFALLTMPADDYPTLPEPPQPLGTVDAALLRSACAQVVPAASPDETLVMLTGVWLDIDGTGLELAATDRYRIAARALTWQPTLPDATAGALVPAKVLHDVARGLTAGPVQIGVDSKQVAFTCGGRQTTARMLDSEFINYRARLTSDDLPITARVQVGPLVDAIKRVALVADRAAPVRLAFTDGQVLVRAGGGDLGRGAETLDCELDGHDIEVAFQPQFIVDGLNAVEGEWARIGMQASAKPALVLSDDPTFRYLVMALRQA